MNASLFGAEVTPLPDGGWALAWEELVEGKRIRLARYDQHGDLQWSSPASTDAGSAPDLIALDGGELVVCWMDVYFMPVNPDFEFHEPRCLAFAGDGSQFYSAFKVYDFTSGPVRIAPLSVDSWTAVWPFMSGGDYYMLGRVFALPSVFNTQPFPVPSTIYLQHVSQTGRGYAIAHRPEGGMLVAWHDAVEPPSQEGKMFTRRFSSDGTAFDENVIEQAEFSELYSLDLEALPTGGFALLANDGASLRLRILDKWGKAVEQAQPIYIVTSDSVQSELNAMNQDLAVLSDGRMAVAWQQINEGQSSEVKIQLLQDDGSLEGLSLTMPPGLNSTSATHPRIVGLANGRFLVVFAANGQGWWMPYKPDGTPYWPEIDACDNDSCEGYEDCTTCPADCQCPLNCTFPCLGRECGFDGCGGTCGFCSDGMTCSNGICVK